MSMQMAPAPLEMPLAQNVKAATSWANWFQLIFRLLSGLTESGTTAQRPTTGLFTGRTYYDTTLTKPIWYSGSGSGWVDATGSSV